MVETIRTFVALCLPAEARRQIGSLQDRLRVPHLRVKWVEPENLHLTLKFLGGVPADRLPSVFEAVEAGCGDVRAFDLSIEGVGAFPNSRRPQVVWVGLNRGREEVCGLAAAIEARLVSVGFPKETRPFRAHATIGRVKERSPIAARLGERIAAEQLILEGMRIHSVEVMKSQLTKQGPVYSVQKSVALAGGEGSG